MKREKYLSLYWKCQFAGWSAASLYWVAIALLDGEFNWLFGIGQFVTDLCCYILLTHLYRNFSLAHHWQQLNLQKLIQRIIPSVFLLGLAYTLVTTIKIYLLRQLFHLGPVSSFTDFLTTSGFAIFMAGIRLMSIWLLAYHLYHYAQRELLINKENTRLALLNRDAQLNNLSAQLNPHFLFNSLNNIKSLTFTEPVSARRAIDLLAELLRSTLYSNYELLTTVKKEIELVKDYLELEKMRLEERLQYQIEVDEPLLEANIPVLSIQTLVENAIKHGVSQLNNGGLITVSVKKGNGYFLVMVQQPGKLTVNPRLTSSEKGIGLSNLQERLQLQYKGKAKLELSQNEGIVSCILQIPT